MLFSPRHKFLIGVDSDGCVFDSMEVKQVMHFHPLIIKHWSLRIIEPVVREVAEYVNLRSPWRGSNRFIALLKTFELLQEHPRARHPDVTLPAYNDLADWVESGETLNHDALAANAKSSTELKEVLAWSEAVNHDIATRMLPVPPFDGAADALTLFYARADIVVISLTPLAALEHDWNTNRLRDNVDAIAGQEWGTKPEQIRLAMSQADYTPDQVLILGDAPGDLKAARETGVRFYPIIPGQEAACWRRLLATDMDLFFQGDYHGKAELDRIGEFEAVLNDPPPWKY